MEINSDRNNQERELSVIFDDHSGGSCREQISRQLKQIILEKIKQCYCGMFDESVSIFFRKGLTPDCSALGCGMWNADGFHCDHD